MEKEKTFLNSIKGPFAIIKDHKLEFAVWLAFVVIAGQLGTIINIIGRVFFDDWELCESLCADSSSGVFYTYSLVLIASILGSCINRFIHKKKKEYSCILSIFLPLLIFLLLFNAVFYSYATQGSYEEFKSITSENITVDWAQLFFFIVSILCAIYAFGLDRLHLHGEYDSLSDSYLRKENADKEKMANESTTIKTDGKGNAL